MYDHGQRQLVLQREFDDAVEAATAYADLEREYHGTPNLEVVLVGSDSIETVRKTHGNYFEAETDVASIVG